MTSIARLVATTAAIAAGAVALAATPASAITFTSLSAQPASTQAGAHPDFTLQARFGDAQTRLRGLRIDLPPGLLGNPNAVPKCPVATFEAGGCTAANAVGSTVVHTLARVRIPILDLIEIPVDAPGTVYNLEPAGGEPARLGIEVVPIGGLLGVIRLQSPVSLRDTSDYGLTSTLDEIPRELGIVDTTITGMDLTLLGVSGGSPFVTLPTSCETATTTVTATDYAGGTASASAAFQPTGCDAVPFDPSINVVPETGRIDSPSGMTITLSVPGEETPIRQSYVRGTRVTLPEGVALNPGAGAGLEACSDAAFARGARTDPACPAASVIGSVTFASPLAGVLAGTVYMGDPQPGAPVRLFIDVPGPGFRIKLIGTTTLDARTGQVTTTFSDLPPLPFTAFTLQFRGGDRAILTTPPDCAVAVSEALLVPFSGGPAASPRSTFTVSADGAGGACPSPPPFAPRLSAAASPTTAGAQTALTTTIARDDATARLGGADLSFPPGLLGGLGGGIVPCALDAARAGTCAAESRVGSATVLSGPGPSPLRLTGDVFLTLPPDAGALAGLAIVIPAKAGPLDLGTVVNVARIVVRPGDAGLDVRVPDLPQIVGGIPLDLRQIELALDRPGFMRNATSCAPGEIAATFRSPGGQTATSAAPYRSTGCADVPFSPDLSGSMGARGQLRKGSHPPVTVAVTQGPNQINARTVTVTLPRQVGVDVQRLGRACPEGQDCGARAQVGTATAVTPLLPLPLTGPVSLVAPAGGGLPELEVQLEGLLSLTLRGTASLSTGLVQTTFDGIPDVPLSRFELALAGGGDGILLAGTGLCADPARVSGTFVGQNGAEHAAQARLTVPGCRASAPSRAPRPRAVARLRDGTLRLRLRGGGAELRRVRVALPGGVRLAGERGVAIRGGGRRADIDVGPQGVTITGLSRRRATLVVRAGALRGASDLDRLTVRVRTAGGDRDTLRPEVARPR